MTLVNRVYLPGNTTLYVSDNSDGDKRLVDLYNKYGDLQVDVCEKRLGESLDNLTAIVTDTISNICFEVWYLQVAA